MREGTFGKLASLAYLGCMRFLVYAKSGKELDVNFKDLRCFSQSLLVKFGWKILQSHHCLMANIVRDKYFGASTFLRVKKGNEMSYLWYNIFFFWRRVILMHGLGWRIGNVLNTSVWTMNQIPTRTYFVMPRTWVIKLD